MAPVCTVIPELEVLSGVVVSMFDVYEESVRLLQLCTWNQLFAPQATYCFHRSPISYSSSTVKRRWITGAKRLLLEGPATAVLSNSFEQPALAREIAVAQLELAGCYSGFVNAQPDRGKTASTALFFTFDVVWSYWGAVAFTDTDRGVADLHIRPLQGAAESPTLAQKKLHKAFRARYPQSTLRMHEIGRDPVVDIAFGWTQMWQGDMGHR